MKQMETTMKKIGETSFYIVPFPAFTSARISGQLVSIIAPIFGSFAPMLKGVDANNTDSLMDMNIEEALPTISEALSQIDGDKLEHLMKQLLIDYRNVSYKDEEGEVDTLTYDDANEIFCGEFQDMLMLCWEVIKLNFGGFFKKLTGQSGSLKEFTEKAKKKLQVTSIGSKSGESST